MLVIILVEAGKLHSKDPVINLRERSGSSKRLIAQKSPDFTVHTSLNFLPVVLAELNIRKRQKRWVEQNHNISLMFLKIFFSVSLLIFLLWSNCAKCWSVGLPSTGRIESCISWMWLLLWGGLSRSVRKLWMRPTGHFFFQKQKSQH